MKAMSISMTRIIPGHWHDPTSIIGIMTFKLFARMYYVSVLVNNLNLKAFKFKFKPEFAVTVYALY